MLNFKNILLCVQFPKTREYKPFILFFLTFNFTLLTFNCVSQNLVFNGDFEIFDTCPTNPSTPGDLQIEHCTGWTAPTKLGTSDYFNVCNNATTWQFAGVPQNLLGYQQPFSGDGYCGFLAFDASFGTHYREYLQTRLINPLELGKKYHLSFYVVTPFVGYTVSKIGALFSENDFNANTYSAIVAQPQVINTSGFLTDTLNWIKIEGEFVADGNEQFLTIGYFVDTTFLFTEDTLNTSPDSVLVAPMSYYYVDGVELIKIENKIIIPNIFTPNGDNINDLFYLNFLFIKVEIFNRWGNKMFESVNNDSYWDGRTNSGLKAPDGTYYYVISTKEETYKGFIQLLR